MSHFYKSLPVMAVLFLCATWANAQNVSIVKIEGQPLVYMKDGKPNGCGLRMIGILPVGSNFEAFDVSVNIYLPGHGVVKAVSYNTSPQELQQRSGPRRVQLQKAWLRARGAAATAPLEGTAMPGDDGVSLLYGSPVDPIFAILKAQAAGTPIHVGIHRKGEPTEKIFAGPIELSKDEQVQLLECVRELVP